MPVVTYLDAISQALREEMRRDPNVFLLGEDIGLFGGAFKVTKGFIEEFGAERVIDTPISESGFAGAACGAAIMGFRPVVEFQFADFIVCAFDQIVNFSGKCYYRWGIPVPVVFRGPSGGGFRGGPFHSQTSKALIVHEAHLTAGFGGEVAGVIAAEAFESLDAPVQRVGALDVPIPFSPPLEDAVLPSASRIEAEARKLLEY